jgi:predicted nucleotidyltransferase
MTDPKAQAEAFVTELETAIGASLKAAALFGSAARGEWVHGLSDVNVLLMIEDIDGALLEKAAPATQRAAKNGLAPLPIEAQAWRRAADVFAIEIADMKDSLLTLRGNDPTVGLVADPVTMRLQAERELRAKLLNLQGALLLAAGEKPRVGEVLVRSLPSFTTYLRTALRLVEQEVPTGSAEVISRGCLLVGADPGAFLDVFWARQDGGKLQAAVSDPLTNGFNTAAERLTAYIDQLATRAGGFGR